MFLTKITTVLRKKSKQGFSLGELSVVILVIGIFVAGAISSTILVKKYRISTARSLTQASSVNSITNLSMWLEGSLEQSFNDSESNEGSSLSIWYDINNSLVTKKMPHKTLQISQFSPPLLITLMP